MVSGVITYSYRPERCKSLDLKGDVQNEIQNSGEMWRVLSNGVSHLLASMALRRKPVF